jgi:protein tyrosine phosphatase (PTP) superfamily phosphohydrolase (DUF442 family)
MTARPVNYHQSTDLIATSGQPDEKQFHLIADEGYDVVINLAMHDSDNALPNEGSIVASLGMHYINIPVPFDEPTAEHLQEFIGLLNVFAGKKIWVHCAVNARVSAFMYHYLTKIEALDAEAATSPLLRKWLPKIDEVWKDFLEIKHDEIGL